MKKARPSLFQPPPATPGPGCIMQLQDSINHAGGQARAVHLLELVLAALPEA